MSAGVRVPFATYNDTITPENSSGLNGFTFPTPIGTFSDGTINPFIMTFQDAIECYWRIKNWTVDTDLSASSNSDTVDLASVVLNASTITNELNLIQPGSIGASGGYEDPARVINGYGTGVGYGISFEMFRPTFNLSYRDDDMMSGDLFVCPYFAASAGVVAGTVIPGPPAIPLFNLQSQFNPDATLTITINVQDYNGRLMGTCTGYVQGIVDSDPSLAWTPTGTFLNFLALEFWPYSARDNTPIYDTTTGAQLQPPYN